MIFISSNLDLLNINSINKELRDSSNFIQLNNYNHVITIVIIIAYNIVKIVTNFYAICILIIITIITKYSKIAEHKLKNNSNKEMITLVLLMILSTLKSKLLNVLNEYINIIYNEYKIELLEKERNNFTICALMNQYYEYNLNNNLKEFKNIWNNLNNNIVPFILFILLFCIYIKNYIIISVMLIVLTIINIQFFIFNNSNKISWKVVKYLRNLCINYNNNYSKTNWGPFTFNTNTHIIINLLFIIIILNHIIDHKDQLPNDFNIILILLSSLSEPMLYNCLYEHYNINSKYHNYLCINSNYIQSNKISFKNFSCIINNKFIFQNISFNEQDINHNPILLKGYGKHQLLCGLFNINSQFYNGKYNKQSIKNTHYIRHDFYTSSMTLKEYIYMDFPNHNDKQLMDIINNIDDFEGQILLDPMNHKYDNKHFSQELRFLIDIYKSLNYKDSLIIIDNPLYILDDWMIIWTANNNKIILLVNDESNINESDYSVINLDQPN